MEILVIKLPKIRANAVLPINTADTMTLFLLRRQLFYKGMI